MNDNDFEDPAVERDDGDVKNCVCGKESQSSLTDIISPSSLSSVTVELENVFFPNYKDSIIPEQKSTTSSSWVAKDILAEFVNDESGFDVAIIRACRKLVSNHLMDHADTETPGK